MDINSLLYALFVTALGLVIVFAILILLRYIIELMRVTFTSKNEKDKTHHVVEVFAHATAAAEEPQNNKEVLDDNELVAVLTAAVVACLGGGSDIVVRKITRVGDSSPIWAKTGRHEQMLERL